MQTITWQEDLNELNLVPEYTASVNFVRSFQTVDTSLHASMGSARMCQVRQCLSVVRCQAMKGQVYSDLEQRFFQFENVEGTIQLVVFKTLLQYGLHSS